MRFLSSMVLASSLFVSLNAGDVIILDKKGGEDSITFEKVSEKLKSENYSVEAVSKLEKSFKEKFQDERFDKYKILAVYEKEIAEKLIAKYPDAGAFTPYSVALQSKADSNDVQMVFLDADTMAKVLGAKDCKLLQQREDKLLQMAKDLGFDTAHPVKVNYNTAAPKGDLLFKKTIQTKEGAEALSEKIEDQLMGHKFSIVNFLDLKDTYESVDEKYDFYTVLSVCKKIVLNQSSKTRPEAAAFAPCSLAIYQEKGSDKVTFAFPSTYNWLSSLNIQDEKAIEILAEEQHLIEGMINSLAK